MFPFPDHICKTIWHGIFKAQAKHYTYSQKSGLPPLLFLPKLLPPQTAPTAWVLLLLLPPLPAPLLFPAAVTDTVVAAPNAVGGFIAADAVTVVLSMLGPTVAAVIIAMVPIAGSLQFVVSVLFDRSILLAAAAAADELINYWQQPCLWHCLETGEQCIDSMVYCCID